MTNDRLIAALEYAIRGWAVFPVHGIVGGACTCRLTGCSSPGKHPHTRRGLHDAVTEEDPIRRWWIRWPDANLGVRTGTVSSIVVIDFDFPEADVSLERLTEEGLEFPATLTAVTGEGRHLYYACDGELHNKARGLPGYEGELPGIDLRAEGGYVVAPPSMHLTGNTYRWLDPNAALAAIPYWIRPPQRRQTAAFMARVPELEGRGTSYGLTALAEEVDRLLHTPEGVRNDQLNRSAFALGQLIAARHLDEGAARSALESAARQVGLEEREIERTLESGVSAGKLAPR